MSKEIVIDGTTYVPKSSEGRAVELDGLKYQIVRTYSAGVFAGYVKSREGKEVVMLQARRLWYWDGASSLSQLAEEGVKNPDNCKFPREVAEVTLTEAVELLAVSQKAKDSIAGVPIWEQ